MASPGAGAGEESLRSHRVCAISSGVTLNRLPHLRLGQRGEQWSMSMGTMALGGVSFIDVRIN